MLRAPMMAMVVLSVLAGGVGVVPPAHAREARGCVIEITHFAFHPRHVMEGEQTALKLRARNCTGVQQDTRLTRYGTEPSPCPVLDPISFEVSFAPYGTYAPRPMRWTAPSCPGVERITVRFSDSNGTILARKTARLHVEAGAG